MTREATQQRHGGGEAGVMMMQEEQEAGGAGVAQVWDGNEIDDVKQSEKRQVVSEKLRKQRNTPAGGAGSNLLLKNCSQS